MIKSNFAFKFFIASNFKNRKLIWDLIKRDFKLRYLGSIFGSYWNFIHPIAMISIYTLVFSKIMKIKLGDSTTSPIDFTIYLCAGLLPWNAMQEVIFRGCSQFHDHANFIKKIAFPKEIIHCIATGSSTITFMISLAIYLIMATVTGHNFSASLCYLPILIFLQMLFSSGIGMVLGVFNVFIRDIHQLLNIIFQIWFWLTPIIYSADKIPSPYRKFLLLNPFYPFINSYQKILVERTHPNFLYFSICITLATISYIIGSSILAKFQNQLADEL